MYVAIIKFVIMNAKSFYKQTDVMWVVNMQQIWSLIVYFVIYSKDVILFSTFFIDRNIIKHHILPLLQFPPSSRWLWQVCEHSTCRDNILFFRFSMDRNIIKGHILRYCNFHHHQADFDKYACLLSLTLFSLCVNELSGDIVRKEKEY